MNRLATFSPGCRMARAARLSCAWVQQRLRGDVGQRDALDGEQAAHVGDGVALVLVRHRMGLDVLDVGVQLRIVCAATNRVL